MNALAVIGVILAAVGAAYFVPGLADYLFTPVFVVSAEARTLITILMLGAGVYLYRNRS